ncbi:tyrosine-protein phosphatase [Butyrivibrio sp. WCD2001]|uniref:tyrosine-protein phosphatase n=1 Tax=Butyrivibrio sp. WCD2001 TaxID=1280681 RepID=UPI0004013B01|nr:tyrosine-protein phosphatase [Butyrivibrio sp. WCD2001]
MASSIIHLAVTNELTKRCEFKDEGRLKFGAILPDAGNGNASHLKKTTWGYNKRVYDFERFRSEYGEKIKIDDLYLGYYLHLVQDICYRHFVFDKYKWNPTIPGNVEKLHKDYSIINFYVASHYGLSNDIEAPADFNSEEITKLCPFDIARLMKSMAKYFIPVPDEDIFFFTKEMADEFISEAVELCLKELKALENGEALIGSYDNAWDNMPYSLLETTLNTRDLGEYRIDEGGNSGNKERYTKYGRIIRSDAAITPSEKDIAFLKSSNITTIVEKAS